MNKIKDCSVYKGQTKKQIIDKVVKIQKLLSHFDLRAYAFDPGIKCFVLGDGVKRVDFNENTWEFIEPLLRELVQWRKYGESFNMNMKVRRSV